MSDAKEEAEAIQRYGDEQYEEGLHDGWRQAILRLEELADAPSFRKAQTNEAAAIRGAFVMVAEMMRARGPERPLRDYRAGK